MTPISSSYLTRDLYRQTWIEPDAPVTPDAPTPLNGERPWWGSTLTCLRRILDPRSMAQGRPVRLGVDPS
jgi:hypothetical protein